MVSFRVGVSFGFLRGAKRGRQGRSESECNSVHWPLEPILWPSSRYHRYSLYLHYEGRESSNTDYRNFLKIYLSTYHYFLCFLHDIWHPWLLSDRKKLNERLALFSFFNKTKFVNSISTVFVKSTFIVIILWSSFNNHNLVQRRWVYICLYWFPPHSTDDGRVDPYTLDTEFSSKPFHRFPVVSSGTVEEVSTRCRSCKKQISMSNRRRI